MAGLFIKLDCDYWDHPKVVQAGVMAGVLYLRMTAYAMQHTTDGYVPAAQLPRFALPATGKLTAALADVGLIEPADGGWLIPGYVERYLSAAELERRRQVNAENGRKGGRPRTQQKPRSVSDGLGNGTETEPRENQEVEVEVEVDRQSSSHGSAARPPAPDDDLADELFHLAGIARPGPTAGQRKQLAAGLRRGWTPDQLRPKFAKAQGTGNPRGYVDAVLVSITNEAPAFVVASAVGTLGEIGTRPLLGERQHCTNPDCVDGMVGGLDPDGRPEPVRPCPDCHVLGATA